MAHNPDVRRIEGPLDELERRLIDEYVRSAGHDPEELRARADPAARQVLVNAAKYAAGKLSEVESREHYLRNLRGQA